MILPPILSRASCARNLVSLPAPSKHPSKQLLAAAIFKAESLKACLSALVLGGNAALVLRAGSTRPIFGRAMRRLAIFPGSWRLFLARRRMKPWDFAFGFLAAATPASTVKCCRLSSRLATGLFSSAMANWRYQLGKKSYREWLRRPAEKSGRRPKRAPGEAAGKRAPRPKGRKKPPRWHRPFPVQLARPFRLGPERPAPRPPWPLSGSRSGAGPSPCTGL